MHRHGSMRKHWIQLSVGETAVVYTLGVYCQLPEHSIREKAPFRLLSSALSVAHDMGSVFRQNLATFVTWVADFKHVPNHFRPAPAFH